MSREATSQTPAILKSPSPAHVLGAGRDLAAVRTDASTYLVASGVARDKTRPTRPTHRRASSTGSPVKTMKPGVTPPISNAMNVFSRSEVLLHEAMNNEISSLSGSASAKQPLNRGETETSSLYYHAEKAVTQLKHPPRTHLRNHSTGVRFARIDAPVFAYEHKADDVSAIQQQNDEQFPGLKIESDASKEKNALGSTNWSTRFLKTGRTDSRTTPTYFTAVDSTVNVHNKSSAEPTSTGSNTNSTSNRPKKSLGKMKNFFKSASTRPFAELHQSNVAASSTSINIHEQNISQNKKANGITRISTERVFSDSQDPLAMSSAESLPDPNSSTDMLASATPSRRHPQRQSERRDRHNQILSMLTPNKLFDFLVVVSLVVEEVQAEIYGAPPRRTIAPRVTYRFPPTQTSRSSLASQQSPYSSAGEISITDQSLLDNIPLFCFPEWEKSASSPEDIVTVEDYLENSAENLNMYSLEGETFSFVLTDLDQSKRFGYCRRSLSSTVVEADLPIPSQQGGRTPGAFTRYAKHQRRLPEVFCIISPAGCFSLFNQILDIVEQRKLSGNKTDVYSFLKAVIAQPFPKPGRTITIKAFSTAAPLIEFSNAELATSTSHSIIENGDWQEYRLHRPLDLVSQEHVSFYKLFAAIGLSSVAVLRGVAPQSPFQILLALLSALLLERRIIFVSQSLQVLSDCCNAAVALIYPLEWQHVFIPILPRRLIDFLCSPTPYIIGVLKSELGRIVSPSVPYTMHSTSSSQRDQLDIEDAIVIDADTATILRHDTHEQDRQFIPFFLINRLRSLLEHHVFRDHTLIPAAPHRVTQPTAKSQQKISGNRDDISTVNSAIAEAFLQFFLMTLGCYREFIEVDVVTQVSHSQNNLGGKSDSVQAIKSSHSLAPVTNSRPVSWAPAQTPNLSKSRSDDNMLRVDSDRVAVWFDSLNFKLNHPLVTGAADSPWLNEHFASSTQNSTFTVRVPNTKKHASPHHQPTKSQSAERISILPTPAQRASLAQFIGTVSTIQSFQYFIQIREEAFQYHYQVQLEKSRGEKSFDWLDLVTSESSKHHQRRPQSPSVKELPNGLKSYYALSQSRFEKKVSHIEQMFTRNIQARESTTASP